MNKVTVQGETDIRILFTMHLLIGRKDLKDVKTDRWLFFLRQWTFKQYIENQYYKCITETVIIVQ